MNDRCIVYISNIPWNYSWHRQQEMASFLAKKGYIIIFVEPCSKKRPFSHSLTKVGEDIYILHPCGLPLERCLRLTSWINGLYLNQYLDISLSRMDIDDYILWIDRVHGIDFKHLCNNKYVVYDLIDELTAFGRWKNKKMLIKLENTVLMRANLLMSSSSLLLKRKMEQSGRKDGGIFIPNGVEISRFANVVKKKNSYKTIGFIGTISKRALNFKMIEKIAKEKPQWKLMFVGPGEAEDKEKLCEMGITVLNQVSGDEVPNVMSMFDVGIIPYNIDNRDMDYVFPRKACEYLAAGIPVVSTMLPEIKAMEPFVYIAETSNDFIKGIESAFNEGITPEDRRNFASKFDWNNLMTMLLNKLEKDSKN